MSLWIFRSTDIRNQLIHRKSQEEEPAIKCQIHNLFWVLSQAQNIRLQHLVSFGNYSKLNGTMFHKDALQLSLMKYEECILNNTDIQLLSLAQTRHMQMQHFYSGFVAGMNPKSTMVPTDFNGALLHIGASHVTRTDYTFQCSNCTWLVK